MKIRYLHDILKLDVILKREFMNDLRAVVTVPATGWIEWDVTDVFLARYPVEMGVV